MKPETLRFLAKARRCLNHATIILTVELGDDAGRAAYLAGFHAAQALIWERTGREAATHRGVRTEFARLTRDDPTFDPAFRPFLARMYDLKTVADYATEPDATISVEEAAEAAQLAEAFVALIERILTRSDNGVA